MSADIAHVQAQGATFVVPARSPYERQMLREHVEVLSSRCARITLGLRDHQWIVTRRTAADSQCASCERFLGRVRCSRPQDVDATCIDCALQPHYDERGEEHDE